MTRSQPLPLALKVMIALLGVLGAYAWFAFVRGVLADGWTSLTPSLFMPFMAWGLSKRDASWRVLTLVYLVIGFFLTLLIGLIYLVRDLGRESMPDLVSFLPRVTVQLDAAGWTAFAFTVVLSGWMIHVLRRQDVTPLFEKR